MPKMFRVDLPKFNIENIVLTLQVPDVSLPQIRR